LHAVWLLIQNLYFDEPFAGVDPVAVEDIHCCQLKIKNIGILITDHNVQETLAITDKTYLMFEGGILKAGIPEELVEDEMVPCLFRVKILSGERRSWSSR
jgi:lipopolysaccharide export system ATP-binding protein